jgi:hypothetical protein
MLQVFVSSARTSRRSNLTEFQTLSGRVALLIGALTVFAPALAIAQTNNTDAGSALWGAFRAVLYVVVGIGIYMFLERGFMHALGVMAAGALLFFVPLIVISMRNAAQAMGGAG